MIQMEASLLVCSSSTTPHALSPVNKVFCMVDISMSRVVWPASMNPFSFSLSLLFNKIFASKKSMSSNHSTDASSDRSGFCKQGKEAYKIELINNNLRNIRLIESTN
ncbi:hypothetical protein NC652_011858 [Populus alba x Populus x berolinensis]|nr:hypothetical protein NC652_011858 [Populus alba x Populus x berolinensis]